MSGYNDGYEEYGDINDEYNGTGTRFPVETQANGEAVLPPKPQKLRGKKRAQGETLDWLDAFVYALIAVFLLFAFVFRVVGVEGSSMVPTLGEKDWLAISHMNFEAERGDIVVITQPNSLDKPLIKRVIGISGDKINIDFDKGIVYVNDAPLDEPYTNSPTNTRGDQSYPLYVPDGCVFVMGDNRNDSLDSRYQKISFIDERYLMGKVIFRIYPFESLNDYDEYFETIPAVANVSSTGE